MKFETLPCKDCNGLVKFSSVGMSKNYEVVFVGACEKCGKAYSVNLAYVLEYLAKKEKP